MKRLFAVALGILTAIGGFVDIGDLVTNAVVGSRFGLGLAWVVLVGVAGICLYADMAGRVAAVSGRATFEIIRERLGPRAGLANLCGLVPHQPADPHRRDRRHRARAAARGRGRAGDVDPRRPLRRVDRDVARRSSPSWRTSPGCSGLTLIVFVVALFLLKPDWGSLGGERDCSRGARHPRARSRTGTSPSRCSAPR